MTNQIRMTTQDLISKSYMGDKVFINGMPKSYFQLKNMKSKSYLVEYKKDGAVNILKANNYQTKL